MGRTGCVAFLLLVAALAVRAQNYPVPERPLNKGPVGKPNRGTDQLFKYRNCYNSNNIPMGVGQQSLCTTLVQFLGTPFPDERSFRIACNQLLGPFCINECIREVALFDHPVYNRNPNSANPLYMYPLGFNNFLKQYALNEGDCKHCMEEYRCFPLPQISPQAREV